MKNLLIIAILISFFSSACVEKVIVDSNPDDPKRSNRKIPTGKSLSALVGVDSCDDVLLETKFKIIDDMEKRIDNRVKEIEDNGYCYMEYYYEDWNNMMNSDMGDWSNSASDNETSVNSPGNSGSTQNKDSADSYSTTNNQVKDVDEADFIKNDSGYIYILADNKLQILDAWPPSESTRISTFPIEGTAKKLFVHNNHALVYSSLNPINQNYDRYGYEDYDAEWQNYECNNGPHCFYGDGKNLKMTVIDISNMHNPTKVRETKFNGAYLNSRRINNNIYTIVTSKNTAIEGIQYTSQEIENFCNRNGTISEYDYDERTNTDRILSDVDILLLKGMYDEVKEENKILIMNKALGDFVPSVEDTIINENELLADTNLYQNCNNFYMSQEGDTQNFISIISFELDKQEPLAATTVLAKSGAVYANESSIYLASIYSYYDTLSWFFEDENIHEATTVHKFNLYPDSIETDYAGSGVVKGNIVNQFSLDEYEEHLRIATTIGWSEYNTLSILKENDSELVVTGTIDHIAPSENIRSVRFNKDKGFIVTFRQTDPLFVLDLSHPEDPSILGELKIPGFSTYIHLLDDEHLLSIGIEFENVILQIFDITDPNNPTLKHKESINTYGSYSEATYNHLAFNYFAEKKILAIPMSICGSYYYENSNYEEAENRDFQGLMVFNVSIDDGFNKLGSISHTEDMNQNEDDYYYGCYDWYSNPASFVKRSIFMDDYLYSISQTKIKIAQLDNLEEIVNTLSLTTE